MNRIPAATLVVALVLALAPTASAAPVVITGTVGKDEVSVQRVPLGNKIGVQVVGAATVTGTDCTTTTSALSGRPVAVTCARPGEGLSVDLGTGDDVLDVDIAEQGTIPGPVTAAGGAGNDLLVVRSNSARTLKGQDGDDTLVAVHLRTSEFGAVVLDGGLGRDLVDYATADEGVSASLATGVATMTSTPRDGPTGSVIGSAVTRTDSLVDVEKLSGSALPDLLVAGTKAGAELFGQGGNDALRGGVLVDALDGGPGADLLDGGDAGDTLTGGTGRDDFAQEKGPDTYQARDGFSEDIVCSGGDVLVIDLVDRVKQPELCPNTSVAAAKHLFDTLLTHGALRVGDDGATRARVQCPATKAEPCAGTLTLRLGGAGGAVLARGRYALAPGRATNVVLRLSRSSAAKGRGKAVTLAASEVDADKRPRRVTSRVRILR